MKRKATPMRPALTENVAGKQLVLPAIYAVPDSLCDALGHIGAEERVVDVHVEVERKRSVFRHNLKKTKVKKKAPTRSRGFLPFHNPYLYPSFRGILKFINILEKFITLFRGQVEQLPDEMNDVRVDVVLQGRNFRPHFFVNILFKLRSFIKKAVEMHLSLVVKLFAATFDHPARLQDALDKQEELAEIVATFHMF
jgi:hypothetical protein